MDTEVSREVGLPEDNLLSITQTWNVAAGLNMREGTERKGWGTCGSSRLQNGRGGKDQLLEEVPWHPLASAVFPHEERA